MTLPRRSAAPPGSAFSFYSPIRLIILLFASLQDRCSGLCGYFFLQKVRR